MPNILSRFRTFLKTKIKQMACSNFSVMINITSIKILLLSPSLSLFISVFWFSIVTKVISFGYWKGLIEKGAHQREGHIWIGCYSTVLRDSGGLLKTLKTDLDKKMVTIYKHTKLETDNITKKYSMSYQLIILLYSVVLVV